MNRRNFIKSGAGAIALTALASGGMNLFAGNSEITVAGLGDCIMARRLSNSRNKGLLKIKEILGGVDCVWANCESPIADISTSYPQYREGDLNVYAPPWAADEFRELGIDCMGIANNHTMDYGQDGLNQTVSNLKRVGISFAGAGRDLSIAAMPRYMDTPTGRVAHIDCAATYHKGSQAASSNPVINGRPGLNHLRSDHMFIVDKSKFDNLKEILVAGEKYYGLPEGVLSKTKDGVLSFSDFKFKVGDSFGTETSCNKTDLKRITDSVKIARNNARIVIVGLHAHDGEEANKKPALYQREFAKACIDSGADVIFSSGPHQMWGVEVYNNRPIFYSLGNFIFHLNVDQGYPAELYEQYGYPPETVDSNMLSEFIVKQHFTRDEFWQAFVPVIRFDKSNNLKEIIINPTWLGDGEKVYDKGSPVLAEGERAQKILSLLKKMCSDMGTNLIIKDNKASIKI